MSAGAQCADDGLVQIRILMDRVCALGRRQWQRSPRAFTASMKRARMYSRRYRPTTEELEEMWSAITRRDGAAFAHNAAQRGCCATLPSPPTERPAEGFPGVAFR